MESQRTNYLRWSERPASQVVELRRGIYTLTVRGEGRCKVTGEVIYKTKRPWRERLGSWPWTPWRAMRRSAREGRRVQFVVECLDFVAFDVVGRLARFQCEDGPYETSDIPTGACPVTRTADSLSFDIDTAEVSLDRRRYRPTPTDSAVSHGSETDAER